MLMFLSLGARDVDSLPQTASSYLQVVHECIIVRGSFEFFFDNPEVSCHIGIQKPCSHGKIRYKRADQDRMMMLNDDVVVVVTT